MNRDKARILLGEGATEEQITNLLNEFHNASKEQNNQIATLNDKLSKVSDYDELKAKLDAIEKENMSEQERLAEEKKQIEANLKNSRIIYNTAKAKEILSTKTFLFSSVITTLPSIINANFLIFSL